MYKFGPPNMKDEALEQNIQEEPNGKNHLEEGCWKWDACSAPKDNHNNTANGSSNDSKFPCAVELGVK